MFEQLEKNKEKQCVDFLREASQKIVAVLTNILKGDKFAAKYALISLISRV